MSVLNRLRVIALRNVGRRACSGEHLRAPRRRLDDWAGRLAGARGIAVIDVLCPFLEARSVSLGA